MTPSELIAARKHLGLTQTELGREIGRSLRQVQYYESGELPVPMELGKLIRFMLAAAPKGRTKGERISKIRT